MIRSIVRIMSLVAASLALSSVAFGQHTSGTGWEAGIDIVFQGSKTLHFDGGTNAELDSDTGLSMTFGYRYSHTWRRNLRSTGERHLRTNLVTGRAAQ